MTFLEILRRAQQRAGSQNKLARRLDVTSWSVSHWYRGLSLPTAIREPILAELAGVSRATLHRAILRERVKRWETARATPPPGVVVSVYPPLAPPPVDMARPITRRPRELPEGGILSRWPGRVGRAA